MAKLEELTPGAVVRGVLPDGPVSVIDLKWFGSAAAELTYKDAAGRPGNVLLYRDQEPTLTLVAAGRPWSFDGDGALLRLVAEAHRIDLAHLFDPLLAVHTSLIEPLPHQITAVYGELLPRQPLRFLLADDPGAGKTIMAGLLIKELLVRGDVRRCLVVCPGSLAEQWQDELARKFQLTFELVTNEGLEAARGNWFVEHPLAIGRLDKLSRDERVQSLLDQVEWDLVICDEAHKLSASFFGDEIKYTKRYRLAQLLGRLTRHLLLLTATPHNGKEEDFQLFMALLDADRFEGKFRDGVHVVDTSDLMRRLVKEQLVTFAGTPLFPERLATTVNYTLSPEEAALYARVTEYVREEFNRADALAQGGRAGTVGFALTVLQRRLASSPEAIYQSLRRRRERLERRLREEQVLDRGATLAARQDRLPRLDPDDLDDLDDAPEGEVAEREEQLVDEATAARTIAELRLEIDRLRELEGMAAAVLRSGCDRKWEELRDLLGEQAEMFDAQGARRKLIIFTEHRDTLNYLARRLGDLLGRPEAVAAIHGGMGREERRTAQERFTQDKDVLLLVATDAAGEGVNLQRAHLMVNYDLPWNPNRLEQRFGRIHRIGQTEVCHVWNLVAAETREGDVYGRLLAKIEQERAALGGQVFDVLGKVAFEDRPLRELLLEAIRYGDRPEVRARLHEVVDRALDRERLRALLEERALARDSMDPTRVQAVREEMERAAARRLQPHYVAAFFKEAFALLGGRLHPREPGRYEITHVPAPIRMRDRQLGVGAPVLMKYERVTFDKAQIVVPGKPVAEFLCPGHPLLDACLDLVLERHRELLKRGAVLVDPGDPGVEARVLCSLEHAVQDARADAAGARRVVSRELQFLEIDAAGAVRAAGAAPYLDYRPATEEELRLVAPLLDQPWLHEGLEARAMTYAVTQLVPEHFGRVRRQKEALIEKTRAAVHERLTKEIVYWDHRAMQLARREEAGKTAALNSRQARRRCEELEARLRRRMEELEQEAKLSPLPPVVLGGAFVVPAGLLARLAGGDAAEPDADARERRRIELLAMQAVMAEECNRQCEPRDVSAAKLGYDIESRDPATGRLRFIEVKGHSADVDTITVTKNEILTALNSPEDWLLAVVAVDGDHAAPPVYASRPFRREPDFAATAVVYNLADLFDGRGAISA